MTSAPVQSVDRAARILLAMGDGGDRVTMTQLATRLGVHKSTVSRLVSTLVRHDLLEFSGREEGLTMGSALRRLARQAGTGFDLPARAQPVLDRLSALTGEAATLAVPDRGRSDHRGPEQQPPRRRRLRLGRPDRTGACDQRRQGAAGLRHPAARATSSSPAPRPPKPIRSGSADQLEQVRERGWATSVGEFEFGLNGRRRPRSRRSGPLSWGRSV